MREALHPSQMENNISKLKKIKVFLEDDNHQQENENDSLSIPKIKASIEKREPTAKSARSK